MILYYCYSDNIYMIYPSMYHIHCICLFLRPEACSSSCSCVNVYNYTYYVYNHIYISVKFIIRMFPKIWVSQKWMVKITVPKPIFLMGWFFGGVKKPYFWVDTQPVMAPARCWWLTTRPNRWTNCSHHTSGGASWKVEEKRGGGPCEYVQRTPSKTTQVQEIEKNICILYTYI